MSSRKVRGKQKNKALKRNRQKQQREMQRATEGSIHQVSHFQYQKSHYSGPIPPPEILAQFNEIVPDAAERIIRMAESQFEHRHKLEEANLKGNLRAQTRGQYIGGFLAAMIIGGGIWVMLKGGSSRGWGLSLVIAAMGTMVGTFVYSRKKDEVELERKRESIPEHLR